MSQTVQTKILKFSGSEIQETDDLLAVEEPLEIRIEFYNGKEWILKNLSVTMRTPGNDKELVAGFLFTEGIISDITQIASIQSPGKNIITVSLKKEISFEPANLERHFYTSSSCGVCGKTSIEAIRTTKKSRLESNVKIHSSNLFLITDKLLKHQDAFGKTGGIHGCAFFNNMGDLIEAKEDVGRHNALDKLIGSLLLQEKKAHELILLLSGRASFELIQKAAMMHVNIVTAVGAPSSLAVELAREKEMTLIGFLKNNRFNIYCGEERILTEPLNKENRIHI